MKAEGESEELNVANGFIEGTISQELANRLLQCNTPAP